MSVIPYSRQDISDADVEAVIGVLRSDYLKQGPLVEAFEKSVTAYCGIEHAVAVNSATSALHIACLALGVGRGDWVWTSPITFVASANCALYCGAQVDFVDIDPRTYTLSVDCLARKLVLAQEAGRLPKVLIPVHMCGQPCDMEAIHALSRRYGFKVIEDAAHALGARYCGEPVGNCRYSDVAVFSFHAIKTVATGEGGMVVTKDAALARRLRLLRSHGVTRDAAAMTHAPDGPWYYQQIELGFNYRMTDIQAALGVSQMRRLDEFVTRRNAIARRYDERLVDLPVRIPIARSDSYSARHLYVVRLKLGEIGRTHLEVFESLRAAGIGVNLHYIPVYRQPYYQRMGFAAGYCPEAESYYGEAVTLPMYFGLTEAQQDSVVSSLMAAIGA